MAVIYRLTGRYVQVVRDTRFACVSLGDAHARAQAGGLRTRRRRDAHPPARRAAARLRRRRADTHGRRASAAGAATRRPARHGARAGGGGGADLDEPPDRALPRRAASRSAADPVPSGAATLVWG